MNRQSPWFDAVPDKSRYAALAGPKQADVVVVGGGMVGIWSALHLALAGRKVVLLEKNHLATGDTGASTGFLTRVPDTSFAMIAERYGAPFLKQVFEATGAAQKDIFAMIETEKMDCDFVPCDSHYGSYSDKDAVLEKEWKALQQADVAVAQAKRDAPFAHAITFANEGKVHSRKLLFALAELAVRKGVEIFEESEVLSLEAGAAVTVTTAGGKVTAPKLVLAAGWPPDFAAELRPLLHPYITYVLAAQYDKLPMGSDAYWDTLDPYFYYRNIDEHAMLIGGGDHAAGVKPEKNPQETLSAFARQLFGSEQEITHTWSGSIFHSEDGLPYIFEHPHYAGRVSVAMGFAGNGLVSGVMAGKILSGFVLGKSEPAAKLFSLERTGAKVALPTPKAAPASAVAVQKIFVPFASASEIPLGKPVCKTLHGIPIVLFRIGDDFFALHNACSHAGGPLCDGEFEGKTVTCPLHGGKFDVTNGQVIGPPPIRNQPTFRTRKNGEMIEVEVPAAAEAATQKAATPLAQPSHWGSLFTFAALAVLFWLLEFAAQFYWLVPDELGLSLVRSFSLSGATLIGGALFSSAVFKWNPRLAVHWRLRRYLGVSGFVFAALHVFSVFHFLFDYNLAAVYFSFNPFQNPVIFGSIAFPILFVMAVTSTDWAMNTLTPKVWKFIHRFVYLAYWGVVFHMLTMNPDAIKNLPGYVLLAITSLALFGELFWFVKIAGKKKFLSVGGAVGIAIILLYLLTGYMAL